MSFVSMLSKNRAMKGVFGALQAPKHGGSEFVAREYVEFYSALTVRANFFLSQCVSLVAMVTSVNGYRNINRKRMADICVAYNPVWGGYLLADALAKVKTKGSRIAIGEETQYAAAEEHASIVPANKFRLIAEMSYYLKTNKTPQ